jgi:hypothetical protein
MARETEGLLFEQLCLLQTHRITSRFMFDVSFPFKLPLIDACKNKVLVANKMRARQDRRKVCVNRLRRSGINEMPEDRLA